MAHTPNDADTRMWQDLLEDLLANEALRDVARTESFAKFMVIFESVLQADLARRRHASAAVLDFLATEPGAAAGARDSLAYLIYERVRQQGDPTA